MLPILLELPLSPPDAKLLDAVFPKSGFVALDRNLTAGLVGVALPDRLILSRSFDEVWLLPLQLNASWKKLP